MSAPPAAAPARKKKKLTMPLLLLVLFFCAVAMPTAIILAVVAVPTLLAWIGDRERGHTTTLTVASLSLVTIAPVLATLWDRGNTTTLALKQINSPMTWFLVFFGAMIGWILVQVIPNVIAGLIMTRDRLALERIRERQKALVEEWGNDIADLPPSKASAAAASQE